MDNFINDFIDRLLVLKMSSKDLPSFVVDMFFIEKRNFTNRSKSLIEQAGVLNKLVSNYTMDKIRFADFRLNAQLNIFDGNIISFATSSNSILGFLNNDSSEEIYEYDSQSLVPLYPVAANQVSFLNALVLLMEMYSRKYKEPDIQKRKEIEQQYFPLIVERAGGDRYADFFKPIIFW